MIFARATVLVNLIVSFSFNTSWATLRCSDILNSTPPNVFVYSPQFSFDSFMDWSLGQVQKGSDKSQTGNVSGQATDRKSFVLEPSGLLTPDVIADLLYRSRQDTEFRKSQFNLSDLQRDLTKDARSERDFSDIELTQRKDPNYILKILLALNLKYFQTKTPPHPSSKAVPFSAGVILRKVGPIGNPTSPSLNRLKLYYNSQYGEVFIAPHSLNSIAQIAAMTRSLAQKLGLKEEMTYENLQHLFEVSLKEAAKAGNLSSTPQTLVPKIVFAMFHELLTKDSFSTDPQIKKLWAQQAVNLEAYLTRENMRTDYLSARAAEQRYLDEKYDHAVEHIFRYFSFTNPFRYSGPIDSIAVREIANIFGRQQGFNFESLEYLETQARKIYSRQNPGYPNRSLRQAIDSYYMTQDSENYSADIPNGRSAGLYQTLYSMGYNKPSIEGLISDNY